MGLFGNCMSEGMDLCAGILWGKKYGEVDLFDVSNYHRKCED